MRSLTQFGHGCEIALLRRRQPVHTNEEEVLIQLTLNVGAGKAHILERDRRLRSDIPNVISPLLEEVGIALRAVEQLIERSVGESDALGLRRQLEGSLGVCASERSGVPILDGFSLPDLIELTIRVDKVS